MSKKQLIISLQKQIDKLQEDLNNANKWVDATTLNYINNYKAAQIRANFLTDNDNEENQLIQNQILNNQIPKKMQWLYWIYINQYTKLWLGRYIEFEHENKPMIVECIRQCILYGQTGYNIENGLGYYIGPYNPKNNTFKCSLLSDIQANGFNAFVLSEGIYKLNNNIKEIDIAKDKLVIFQWQDNGLGIFTWYLPILCLYILQFIIIPFNSASLLNKLYVNIYDPNNYKTLYKSYTDPFDMVVKLIGNKEIGDINRTNEILKVSSDQEAHIEQLIIAAKFVKEELCSLFGIPITSAKQQSLSADANLSASTSDNIASIHDNNIKTAMQKLGINLEIKKPEPIIAQNDNADKQGQGIANTNGDNIKEE